MPHILVDMEVLWRDVAEYSRDLDAMEEKRRIDYANKVGFDALMRQRIGRAHTVFMASHLAGGIEYSGDLHHKRK